MKINQISHSLPLFILRAMAAFGLALALACQANAAANVAGDLNGNTTWTLANSPYTVTGNVQVPAGSTLTIEPGVTVRYAGAYQIYIRGTLLANGTAGAPITFRSPTAGVSSGATMLKFEGTNLSDSQLSHVHLKDAAKAVLVGGGGGEFNPGLACTGTLTVSQAVITNAEVRTGGYQTPARLVLDQAVITNATIIGQYPLSEPIDINDSTITSSVINSDAYNLGITLTNTAVSSSELRIGCCGANLTLVGGSYTNSSIGEGFGSGVDGPLTISGSTFTNTTISLPAATVAITNAVFTFTSGNTSPKLLLARGSVQGSTFTGNGSGTGLEFGSGSGNISLTGCTLSNFATALRFSGVRSSGSITVSFNTIAENTGYNLDSRIIDDITATYNFWGTTSSTIIGQKIFDQLDQVSSGLVLIGNFLLSPPVAPSITTHPTSAHQVITGTSVSFNAAASGNPPPTYQWKKDGAIIAGATSATLTLAAVTEADAGEYTMVATNGLGSVTSATATLTLEPVHSTQIRRLYTQLIAMAPTSGELAAELAALQGGGTLEQLLGRLLTTPAYLAREKERAIRLYYATFSRMPDQMGLHYWASVLGGGSMSPAEVATAFAQSQEFRDTYGSLTNEAFVTQLYRNTLGRDPDAGGRSYWLDQMNAGLTRGQMLLAFADSHEFADRMAPEIEVVRVYHLLFDRMPTTQEYNNWRGFLRGYDQTETILNSTEFTTLHPSGLTNAQYVQATFQGFLLRSADQATQDHFATLLGTNSLSRAELIHQIMDSGEFRTTVVPVIRHYLAVFRRAPDLVGSTHWTNQMRAGLGFTQLSQVFADSAEFTDSYAGLTDADFVSQMYLNILGRPADPGGLAHWVNLFAADQSGVAGLLLSFVLSSEASWRFASDIRTIGHYQSFYGRNPTGNELLLWKNYLTSLPTQFRQEMLNSAEFTPQ